MLWSLQGQSKIVSEAVSRPTFDQSTQNLVRFIDTMNWGYVPKLGTAPPMGSEVAKMHNFAYNFWKHCSNFVISISFHSLGYANSDYVSFVIFHEGACQPYWSKWKTVFSLLLIQILSNFVQNVIIRSLDRPAQKWLNRFLIFTTVPEKIPLGSWPYPCSLSYASNLSILLNYRLNNYRSV